MQRDLDEAMLPRCSGDEEGQLAGQVLIDAVTGQVDFDDPSHFDGCTRPGDGALEDFHTGSLCLCSVGVNAALGQRRTPAMLPRLPWLA